MARPSSSKGRVTGSTKSGKGKPGKKMHAETADAFTPELFPEPRTRLGRTAINRPWDSQTDDDDSHHAGEKIEEDYQDRAEISTAQSVPKSWVKFVVALFLFPFAWVLTQTFLQTFTASLHNGLLANPSAGYFTAGVVFFGVLYLVIPQKALMIPYVLGHEVTHAIWVKLFGGKVADQFHVSLDGGHVLTDRVNTWIALAPYFFPIYSVLVVTLYGAASLATDMSPFRPILFLLLGSTIAFHLVFTCLLIVRGQPDLHYGGTFFSLMVIYLINLGILTCLLLIFDIALAEDAAKHHKVFEASWLVTLGNFGGLFVKNALGFVDFCIALIGWISSWIADFIAGFGKK